MTGLIAKVEALAAETGEDVEKLWDEFVAFVRGKKEAAKEEKAPETGKEDAAAEGDAPKPAPESSAAAGAPQDGQAQAGGTGEGEKSA